MTVLGVEKNNKNKRKERSNRDSQDIITLEELSAVKKKERKKADSRIMCSRGGKSEIDNQSMVFDISSKLARSSS